MRSYYIHERRVGCSFFEIGNKNEILGIKNQKSMEELRYLQERRGKKKDFLKLRKDEIWKRINPGSPKSTTRSSKKRLEKITEEIIQEISLH